VRHDHARLREALDRDLDALLQAQGFPDVAYTPLGKLRDGSLDLVIALVDPDPSTRSTASDCTTAHRIGISDERLLEIDRY
jgi:hypothetical protein